MGRLSPSGRRSNGIRWNVFLRWLRTQRGWENATPEGLVEFQEAATGRKRFEILNLIQKHVSEKGGTRKGMLSRYTAIRSFFLHNRVELPQDTWDPGAGTKEPTQGRLNVELIHRVIEGAKPRDRAILLTIFQGLMDLKRFNDFNKKGAESLVTHLRSSRHNRPLRIDFLKGRKANHKAFYTFIGRDALASWREYFEKERSWPKPNEPLAIARRTERPMTEPAIRSIFDGLCFRFELKKNRPVKGDPGHRTGINLHEFRDVARSYLQAAKSNGLDETCVEFWMGHSIDPLNYNKFAELNPAYVEQNYRIAEKHLNILSTPLESEQIQQQEERIQALEKQLADIRQMIQVGISQLEAKRT